jgi:hypothetical protein
MVSSVFGYTDEELIKRLKEIAALNALDPDYLALRKALPEKFPF